MTKVGVHVTVCAASCIDNGFLIGKFAYFELPSSKPSIDRRYVVGLHEAGREPLEAVGGKGANLARLAAAGFAVPSGLVVTTRAYRVWTAAAGIAEVTSDALASVTEGDLGTAERASQTIQARFSCESLPGHVAEEIAQAYESVGAPPVAVRSSATAEDLAGLSFAGLHDTLLNIVGTEQLLEAIVGCWASLWTARAIAYRSRQRVGQLDLAMAVVVQAMAPADASGVLFTANPLNGSRDEMVIDAVLGLGESLVSGKAEPDRYVVRRGAKGIESRTVGAKAMSTLVRQGGGTYEAEATDANRQAILDDAILELAALGERVESLFNAPQDIEWAWSDSGLSVLQSRPITTLYPVPEAAAGAGLRVYFSFAAVQGMLDPITPFGQDTIRGLFGGLAGLFGAPVSPERQRIAYRAGERLWLDATTPLGNAVGRKALLRLFSVVEPGVASAARAALEDPRLSPVHSRPRLGTILRIARRGLPMGARFAAAQAFPGWSRRRAERVSERLVRRLEKRFAGSRSLQEVLDVHDEVMALGLRTAVARLVPRVGAGLSSLALLRKLAGATADGPDALEVTRSLPHNPTTEMDLALWAASRRIASDPEAAAAIMQCPATELAATYARKNLPSVAQQALEAFLDRYGMRGAGEIDMGRSRWRENPAPVIETLQGYLRLDDPGRFPDTVFQAGDSKAREVGERVAGRANRGLLGPLRGWVARRAIRRVRELAGLREVPKFMVMQLLGMSRAALLAKGTELTAAGTLDAPADIFFLRLSELRKLGEGAGEDLRPLVVQRRLAYAGEQRRKRIPLVLLSDGRAFHGAAPSANAADGSAGFTGTPVSPGVVEGAVRVVMDPQGADLKTGEVLVCRGTDPAWTPLFLIAGALITEVGGLMTHGSVLAREYGIPAVVGIPEATTTLQTGQLVRVDGSTGRISLIG